ncbi:MAG: hypothetical protein ACRC11_12310 [Xenococcaceae cyanobacterium]
MKKNIDKQNQQIKNCVNDRSDWLSQVEKINDVEANRVNGGRRGVYPDWYSYGLEGEGPYG